MFVIEGVLIIDKGVVVLVKLKCIEANDGFPTNE